MGAPAPAPAPTATWAPTGPSAPGGDASRGMIAGVAILVVAVLATMGYFTFGRSSSTHGDEVAADDAPAGAPVDHQVTTTAPGDGDGVATSAVPAGAPEAPTDTLPPAPTATFACTTVDPHAWVPAPTDADLVAELAQGSVPSPSIEPGPIGEATISSSYPTSDDFLAQSSVSDPSARRAAMAAAGYRGGIENEYADVLPSTVQVLAFRDATAAEDYVVARLPDLCQLRGTDALVPLGDDGFAFIDGLGAVHGEFLLGGNQISLTLCECADDGLAHMVHWYEEWVAQYGR